MVWSVARPIYCFIVARVPHSYCINKFINALTPCTVPLAVSKQSIQDASPYTPAYNHPDSEFLTGLFFYMHPANAMIQPPPSPYVLRVDMQFTICRLAHAFISIIAGYEQCNVVRELS